MAASRDSRSTSQRGRPLRDWLRRLDLRAWGRLGVWLMMTLAMSGIPGSLEAIWRDLESALLPKDFADLVKLTAPLTLSIALLTLGWRWGWFREGGAIPMGGILVAGAWLGQFFGHTGAVAPAQVFPVEGQALLGLTVLQAGNYLIAYAQTYGPAGFAASVMMGLYLGRWWEESLRTWLRRYGPQPMTAERSEAGTPVPPNSRAA